ncbi:response regulator [bacterium]|nr:response regulator [bacterium]
MKQILIIEDSKGQQKVYKYWFSDHSLVERAVALPHLDFCDKISDALRLVQTTYYDVILLDLHLGESESGFSFLDNFELKDSKPKVIVVSAYFSSLKEPMMKENKDIVWLDKEEATFERLTQEMKLKEDS